MTRRAGLATKTATSARHPRARGGFQLESRRTSAASSTARLSRRLADRLPRSSRCASLHGTRITCIDAAILSYGLLELLFADVKRRLLAIHRRDPAGEECGHCVDALLERRRAGRRVLQVELRRASATATPSSPTSCAVAASYAKAYLDMGFEPLYFGVTTLEEVAPDIDWRFDAGAAQRALRAAPGALRVRVHAGPLSTRGDHAMKTTIEDVPSLLLRLHAGDRAAPALSFYRGRRLARQPRLRRARRPRRARGGDAAPRSASSTATASRWLSPNGLELPVWCWRSWRIGAVVVPLNPNASNGDWKQMLEHSGARGLVGGPELADAPGAAGLGFVRSFDETAAGRCRRRRRRCRGDRRRAGDHPLHVGDDRAAQGRGARPSGTCWPTRRRMAAAFRLGHRRSSPCCRSTTRTRSASAS